MHQLPHSSAPVSGQGHSRRSFLVQSSMALAALAAGCATSGGRRGLPPVAFNTANLVARFTGYRYELEHWGAQHQLTVARTDEAAWAAICREIADCGFRTIEIWEAHAAPEALNRARAATWKRILDDHGLQPIAYAGGLRPETIEICQWLGIPHVDGGLRGLSPDAATALCRSTGMPFNLENHPEKTVEQILAPIGGGNDWLGVCVDTGWLGTQGADAPAVIRALGPLVRHTHIKDVKAAGAHETCLLGEGVVDVAGAIRALREIGYPGAYAWEDEPEDRNPFDSAVRNRQWIEQRLAAG
ncbi:MAG: sugar phosphate isomerase/epimerase family protein [Limisphaerales bacterium]